jgi:hypothetical protein
MSDMPYRKYIKPTWADRVRLEIVRRLPAAMLGDPFEIFIAFLCFISGVPLAIGNVQPASIEESLPRYLAQAWGIGLVVGSGVVLLGAHLAHRELKNTRDILSPRRGQEIERLGLLLLGYVAVIYAVAIILVGGIAGVVAASITFGFGLVCWLKAFLIRTHIIVQINILTANEDAHRFVSEYLEPR